MLLCFVGIDSPETSNERVFIRVAEGGHDVPADKLMARFPRTMANLAKAIRVLPCAYILDNSDAEDLYRFVAEYERGQVKPRAEEWPAWFAGVVAQIS